MKGKLDSLYLAADIPVGRIVQKIGDSLVKGVLGPVDSRRLGLLVSLPDILHVQHRQHDPLRVS